MCDTRERLEGWMCGFFCNNGSLTGDTLLRQFDQVTIGCESIGSQVHGLVLDASGNNVYRQTSNGLYLYAMDTGSSKFWFVANIYRYLLESVC